MNFSKHTEEIIFILHEVFQKIRRKCLVTFLYRAGITLKPEGNKRKENEITEHHHAMNKILYKVLKLNPVICRKEKYITTK